MMNSYNENLHSTVVGALNDLDVARQQVTSQANAAMFTLYHAEGAAITADEQLAAAKASLTLKESVKEQAVNNSNISNNELASATQGAQYVKQSVTNTAVGAANIQVAATAIVRLAGDLGGIYSIVHAADFDTDIYSQTNSVRDLINETAYLAETVSQWGMEASAAVAEVSASTVLDKSKVVNTAVNNLLKIASTDFDTANQLVAAANTSLATFLASEKLAEGALEDISVDYVSTKAAYNATNVQLNLGLRTSQVTNTGFTVWFDGITNPFRVGKNAKPLYPVSQYYVVVVKETKQFTFSISDVENLIINAIGRLVPVGASDIFPLPTAEHGAQGGLPVGKNSFKKQIDIFNLPGKKKVLQDSDGDDIGLGVNYVVFVAAIYQDEYKKKLNDFSDFLSAPSMSFCLAKQLDPVATPIWVVKLDQDLSKNTAVAALPHSEDIKNILEKESSSKEYTYALIFVTAYNENKDLSVEYRSMLLPVCADLDGALMTKASLGSLLDDDVQSLEKIFDTYDPLIAQYESDLLNLDIRIQEVKSEAPAAALAATEDTAAATLSDQLVQQRKTVEDDLKKAQADKQTALKTLQPQVTQKPGFFFNLHMAEQVADDNYTVANLPDIDGNTTVWMAFFGPNSTDNFGNRLMDGMDYVPVVLTSSLVEESDQDQFLSALSDVTATDDFTYAE